jgi:hypothetical protein
MKYEPSPWGREFHALSVDEALGGGAAGPGKSLALLMDPMEQVVVEHERCRAGEIRWGNSSGWALHTRREFPRLAQSIHRSKLLFSQLDPGAKYDEQGHMWTFSSGYKFQFGHLKDNDSFLNYRSAEYTHLGLDELGEIDDKNVYDELSLRVRSTDPVLQHMLKVRACSNPFPNWVRDYFVDPAPAGRVILSKRIPLDDGTVVERSRMFLPARLSDNPDPIFRRQYEASLRDRPFHIRAALLNGDWYVVAGAFFAEEWDPDRVVIKPFKIPREWRRFRSGDWGYKEECVILWWAIDPEGNLICYRELTLNGRKAKRRYDAREVAEKIKEIELAAGEWNTIRNCSRLTGYMDTQLWEERGHRGATMADDMAAAGVHWKKATKGRKQAAQQMITRLRERGVNGEPGLIFFETCLGCITTIPAIGTDDTDPEKPKDGGPDHWLSAVMYAVAANPLPGDQAEIAHQADDDEYDAPTPRQWGQWGYGAH